MLYITFPQRIPAKSSTCINYDFSQVWSVSSYFSHWLCHDAMEWYKIEFLELIVVVEEGIFVKLWNGGFVCCCADIFGWPWRTDFAEKRGLITYKESNALYLLGSPQQGFNNSKKACYFGISIKGQIQKLLTKSPDVKWASLHLPHVKKGVNCSNKSLPSILHTHSLIPATI